MWHNEYVIFNIILDWIIYIQSKVWEYILINVYIHYLFNHILKNKNIELRWKARCVTCHYMMVCVSGYIYLFIYFLNKNIKVTLTNIIYFK